MTTDETHNQNTNGALRADPDRLDRLVRPGSTQTYNPHYSKFIRWMRLVLPLVALAIATVVFTWSHINDTDFTVSAEKAPQTMGKNELLNPRFESVDDKRQPFTVTAQRASQSQNNEDLIMLESPIGDMKLNNGSVIGIKANRGAYRQEEQRLLLQGDVKITHDDGYNLDMAQLHVDLNKNRAWADVDVSGEGPAGTIEAKGLQADSSENILIFNGPARLTINREGDTDMGGLFAQ